MPKNNIEKIIKKTVKQWAKVTEAAVDFIAARDRVINEEDEYLQHCPTGSQEHNQLIGEQEVALESLNDEVEKFNELVEKFSLEKRSKNEKDLKAFHEYCRQNPELRFWQALKNWSGFKFIFGKTSNITEQAMDTYNIEDAIQKRLEIQEQYDTDHCDDCIKN